MTSVNPIRLGPKKCKRCRKEFAPTSGTQVYCPDCIPDARREQDRRKYEAHRDDILARKRATYQADPQAALEKNRAWARAHPDQVRAAHGRWIKKHRRRYLRWMRGWKRNWRRKRAAQASRVPDSVLAELRREPRLKPYICRYCGRDTLRRLAEHLKRVHHRTSEQYRERWGHNRGTALSHPDVLGALHRSALRRRNRPKAKPGFSLGAGAGKPRRREGLLNMWKPHRAKRKGGRPRGKDQERLRMGHLGLGYFQYWQREHGGSSRGALAHAVERLRSEQRIHVTPKVLSQMIHDARRDRPTSSQKTPH